MKTRFVLIAIPLLAKIAFGQSDTTTSAVEMNQSTAFSFGGNVDQPVYLKVDEYANSYVAGLYEYDNPSGGGGICGPLSLKYRL